MTQKNYNCTQQELYSAGLLAWESCSQHLPSFESFSPMYTAPFVTDKKQQLLDAEVLPDAQARSAQREILRIELEQLAKICLEETQKLKRYIVKAWDKPFHKPRLEEAGFNYYEKASNNDWESCKGLLTSAENFLATNSVALLANLNMPPTFEAAFQNNKVLFFEKHQAFLDSEEAARIATEVKQLANNDVYSNCIAMCLDGQEIFKNNDATKKQFVWEEILYLVSGTGTAGIKGTITDETTGLPVPDVTVELVGTTKTAVSDEEGKYIINQVAANSYNAQFTEVKYVTKTVPVVVSVGTVSTYNIQLLKI